MAKLTDDEQAALDALLAKREAPDDEPGRKSGDVSLFIDLSDEQAVRRGLKLGVLQKGDLDEFDDAAADDDDDDDDDDADDGARPRRKADAAPRRRLTVADRMMRGRDD